jgi:transposase-like protein
MKTIGQKKTFRYSISFKQMVVKEVEEGASFGFVRKKYDIGGGATISNWIKSFGKHHLLNKVIKVETMNERDKLKQLEQDNKKLKMALADAYMAKECLEGVIKMANAEYKTDLKKNFGTRSADNAQADTQ